MSVQNVETNLELCAEKNNMAEESSYGDKARNSTYGRVEQTTLRVQS